MVALKTAFIKRGINNMKAKGVYLAALTALISGISIFINKYAVGSIQPPLVFTAVKNSLVAILIFAGLLLFRKLSLIKKLTRRESVYLLLIGLIGGALPFYLFFTGLSSIPAINAAIIQKTLVIWVAMLATPFLGEKLSRLQVIAITLIFFSNLLIGGFSGFKFSVGELMVLAATILWAIENILAKKILATVDPDLVTAARMGIGSIVLMIASVILYPRSLTHLTSLQPIQLFWLSATAVALVAYTTSWYRALKYAPASIVTATLVASTLITNVLSAIFVTHNLSIIFTVPSAALLCSLILLLSSIRSSAVLQPSIS